MTLQPLDEYFAALDRLIKGTSQILPKGTKITNDAVALEAGRGKGSIKKGRATFADLIEAIRAAADEQSKPKNDQKDRLSRAKTTGDHYKRELEAALAREISLLYELFDVKKKLAKLTGGMVLPLRGR